MNNSSVTLKTAVGVILLTILSQQAQAAIALDRTRVIFDGDKSSTTTTITNQNKTLPYLAQTWIEDGKGNKIDSPFTALPPLQRVEPGAKGQIKIQSTGNTSALPQDRESIFYFNVREIPPKSSKPNTLQLALQTRVKMFYRPAALALTPSEDNEIQKKLTLTAQGDSYQLNNPTPYYVTISGVSASGKTAESKDFQPIMVAPKSSSSLGVSVSALGSHPVLSFINDYGGHPQLNFNCSGSTCTVANVKAG
ncbi:fimbria/pilus periplasmic chaperone [Enterobacter hormaechei]